MRKDSTEPGWYLFNGFFVPSEMPRTPKGVPLLDRETAEDVAAKSGYTCTKCGQPYGVILRRDAMYPASREQGDAYIVGCPTLEKILAYGHTTGGLLGFASDTGTPVTQAR